MVVQAPLSDSEANRLFHALADTTRRDIVRRTLRAELSVSELAQSYAMSFAAVQKHVAVLEAAGLIHKTPSGRARLVRADPRQLARANSLLAELEKLWQHRLSQLDQLLSNPGE